MYKELSSNLFSPPLLSDKTHRPHKIPPQISIATSLL